MAAPDLKGSLEFDDIQGVVIRGYGNLKAARFILLGIDDGPAARRWLAKIERLVTSAEDRPEDFAINIAFTAGGLRRLGLPDDVLAGFSFEFRDGMTSPHRSRVLGDVGESSPDRWEWGGPSDREVDAIVMVYAEDDVSLEAALAEVERGQDGVSTIRRLETSPLTEKEHFGFHDGISQPDIDGAPRTGPADNTVRAGEFLLGYQNEYGWYTDRPSLERSADPSGVLPTHDAGSSRVDLGRNGSYLVFRQLAQDVPGFWRFVAKRAGFASDNGDGTARDALAAKMVGRWPSGAPLVDAPDADNPALADANEFAYHHSDPHGLRCPKGSHIRRTHPRDSLDPDPGSAASIAIDKRHRIVRRGRQYGDLISPDEAASGGDSEERGLYFICLNANLARQFEFIQHTWMNNPKFDGLYDDADPIVTTRSDGGNTFTIPDTPIRRRETDMPTFVKMCGGAYFFLPGLRALRYLASMDD